MSLRSLASELTKKQLKEIAAVHNIVVQCRGSINSLVAAVLDHECHCQPTSFVFEVLRQVIEKQAESYRARNATYKGRVKTVKKNPKRKFKASAALRAKRKSANLAAKKRKSDGESTVFAARESIFPPAPASLALRHAILTDMEFT
jgi:hypothetical protein